MGNYYSAEDLLSVDKIYFNSLRTDILQEFYMKYIMDKVHRFDLANNESILLNFKESQFCHLAGLHYFGYERIEGWNKLLKKPKNIYSLKAINNDAFKKMQFRLINFNKIYKILNDPRIFKFEKKDYPKSTLKSKYFAVLEENDRVYKLGIGVDNSNTHYPETLIIDKGNFKNYYLNPDNELNILLKEQYLKSDFIKLKNIIFDNKKEIAADKEGSDNMQNDKTKEIMEKLQNGIKETLDSEKYKNFLRVQSQFHTYSFNNAMLIYLQKPTATRVAGYQTWKKTFERQVVKGEKGIGILAPCPFKYEKWIDKVDPNTNKPMRDSKTGEIVKDKKLIEGIGFKKVTVFDISQTQGKELPSICDELQGNSVNADSVIRAIKQISNVQIVEKNIDSGAKGYYSRLEDLIAINKGMSLDQTAKTVIHEYAHSQLHNTEESTMLDRATKEVQAESVAYIVADHFGVDTSEYSFEYLASWSDGKELSELKSSFNLIQKTADKTIKSVEEVLNKELLLQNSYAKVVIVWSESDQLKKGQMLDIEEANKLFTKLDKEQNQLRGANTDIDYTKVTASEQIDYVPYLKTKFELRLSDGTTSEGRFDFGESDYKDIYECIKHECHIDVKEYIKEQETQQSQEATKSLEPQLDIKDKIITQYSKEFPAIKHISENTAKIINNINQDHDHSLTIKEIKQLYKNVGKKLEASNSKSDLHEFNTFKEVVDGLKAAKLKQKAEHSNLKSKSMTHDIELTQ